ncbi:MAG: glycosyltransferase family 4 protein, partial [Clostridiales bacterium]|nr:glycosyltransferase family 4 protein [Clostridiales bacterium]
MRVLLINHFPLEGSGSGTYSGNIARYLIKNGHEICLVFPENTIPEELPGVFSSPVYFSEGGQNPVALPYNFPCFTTHPRSNTTFADLDQNELEQYLAAFDQAIAEKIAAFRPDIVHVQHIWLLAYLVAKYQIPFVITTHGTDLIGYEKWPEFRRFCDIAADKSTRIIAISRDNYQSVIKTFPQAKNKTLLMPNGYNSDIFFLEETGRTALLAEYGISYGKELILLFAGKLTAVKGLDILLSTAQKYEKLQPGNIITVIAGTGEKKEELLQLKEELKLESVYFIGHRNQNELRRLYSNADIFVMPSRYEAFGLVALEAMACGLPAVASNVGGPPD